LIFILCFSLNTKAQNLVSNGYFEIYDTCPNYPGQISRAVGWLKSSLTPDYYNSCPNINSVNGINVPYTQFGYQQDCCGGEGYAGIYVFYTDTVSDGREYIYTKLIDTLKAGHKYLASIYVSQCNDYNYAIATMGMLFTDTITVLPWPKGFIHANPQVKNTTLLADTVNWMLVQDTITATGNEVYLTIGNFNTNATSDTVRIYNTFQQDYGYYYVDGVSVYDVATLGIEQNKNKVDVSVYPNPNNGKMVIEYNLQSDAIMQITDVAGKLINEYNLSALNNKLEIHNNNLINGVYLYRIIDNNQILKTGKIVIMK